MHAIGLNRPSRFCDSTAPSPLSDGSSSTVKSFDYTYRRKAWSCQLCPGSSGTQAFDRLASLLTVLRTAPRPTCLGVLVVARSAEQVSCKRRILGLGLFVATFVMAGSVAPHQHTLYVPVSHLWAENETLIFLASIHAHEVYERPSQAASGGCFIYWLTTLTPSTDDVDTLWVEN